MLPTRPCCQMPLSILARLCLDPKHAFPNPRPKSSIPGSQSLSAGHAEVCGSCPSVLPSRSSPGTNPKSEGSPVPRPLCSGHLRLLTLKVGLEVTFAEAAEVAMQRSQVPGGGRGRG